MPQPEFEIVWNGTKDRRGACPRLSGYTGASSLNNAPTDVQLAHGEQRDLTRALSSYPSYAGFRWAGRTHKTREAA